MTPPWRTEIQPKSLQFPPSILRSLPPPLINQQLPFNPRIQAPIPKYILRPARPPPIDHPLAPFLRPLYLHIVNQQLAIEIEEARIIPEVRQSPVTAPSAESKSNKSVHWNDVKEEIIVERYIGIKDGLDEDQEQWEDFELEEDEDFHGEAYDADDEAHSTRVPNYSDFQPGTSYSVPIAPAEVEEDFIVPFPSRIPTNTSISGPKDDFDLPFPPLKEGYGRRK